MTKINFILHPKQKEVAKSAARFRCLVGGRRFGKSSLALALAIAFCVENKEAKVWIIAPTYQQAKDIFWRSSEKIPFWTREFARANYPVKKNDSELLLQFPNGSLLQLKGSDREDTLRGSGLDFVILDEMASMKPNVWKEIIFPSLLDSGGKAMFISTPRGYNHFYNLFLKGKRNENDWESFQYTSYQNPYIDKAFLDQAKADSDEQTFAQEYLAEFHKYYGLVYPEFDRKTHVIQPTELDPGWTYGVGIDRGLTNPSGVVFCAIDPDDNFFVYDEIYATNLISEQLVDQVNQKAGHYLTYKFCDPSAADFMATALDKGMFITPATKEGDLSQWVLNGIAKVKAKLKIQEGTGKPKLFVFNHCKNLINEFQQYRWLEKSNQALSERDKPDKNYGFDHLLDGLRYLIGSYKNQADSNWDQAVWERQVAEEKRSLNL